MKLVREWSCPPWMLQGSSQYESVYWHPEEKTCAIKEHNKKYLEIAELGDTYYPYQATNDGWIRIGGDS